MAKPCPVCDVELPEQRYKGNPRRWCSDACRVWALRHPGAKRMRQRSCAACGVDISHMQYDAKVCSKRCYAITCGTVRAEPLPDRACVVCGVSFAPSMATAKYCSAPCRADAMKHRPRRPTARKRPYTDADRDRDHRKRARKKQAATGAPVRRDEIAARDKYRCGICRQKVDMVLAWPHPMSPSLDHIDPLSLGGPHDPANVRLAHLQCNVARSNRGGGEQLMLVG